MHPMNSTAIATGNEIGPALFAVFGYDLRRRLSILREELNHLRAAIRFRVQLDEEVSEGARTQATYGARAGIAPNRTVLGRIDSGAEILLEECKRCVLEFEAFQIAWRRRERRVQRSDNEPYQNQHSIPLGGAHFYLVWHTKMLLRASEIAERLGDLHDRLDWLRHRTNPDHPEPTVRRRAEQGLYDKFLSQHVRWVHRDLAALAIHDEFLGNQRRPRAAEELRVDQTVVTWNYLHTSQNHTIEIGDEHAWLERLPSPGESTQFGARKTHVVSLSYWSIERPALHPIIAHEVGHLVIGNRFGRPLSMERISDDRTPFGRVMRRLVHCIERWYVAREGLDASRHARSLAQECMADLFGAARYGYAYAYAWLLEILNDDQFRSLVEDTSGNLKRHPERPGASWEDLVRNGVQAIAGRLHRLREQIPTTYYRGRVLCAFLEQLRLERDSIAMEFHSSLRQVLNTLLELYTGGLESDIQYHRSVANDLVEAACQRRDVSQVGSDAKRISEWTMKLFPGDLIRAARTLQGAGGRYFPWETQTLSHSFKTIVNEWVDRYFSEQAFNSLPCLSAETDAVKERLRRVHTSLSGGSVRTIHDLVWRIEWSLDIRSEWTGMRPGGESFPHADMQVEDESYLQSWHDYVKSVRTLITLGMDDYLASIARPDSIERNFLDSKVCRELSSEESMSDSIDLESVRKSYVEGRKRLRDCIEKADDQLGIMAVLEGGLWSCVHASARAPLPPQFELVLMNVSSTGVPLTDFNRMRARLADDGSKAPMTPINHTLALGRYDVVGLFERNTSTRSGDHRYEFYRIGENAKEERIRTAVQAWRTKRITPLAGHGSVPAYGEGRLACCILISLLWENGRVLAAEWISRLVSASKVNATVALSDGWEDIVVLVWASDALGSGFVNSTYAGVCEAVSELLKRINAQQFIRSTETIYSAGILGALPSTFNVCFAGRFGRSSSRSGRNPTWSSEVIAQEIVRIFREDNASAATDAQYLQVQRMAGLNDFLIRAAPEPRGNPPNVHDFRFRKNASAIHRALHELAANTNARIETIISW